MPKIGYLILENGKIFEGEFFGAEKETFGELVFFTGMTGYLETLTGSGACGQIVLQTFPLTGNYGVIPEDFESDSVRAGAYIVKSWCEEPSNFRCEGDLDTFFKSENAVGLCGIDTREVTKILRENGSLNCKISYSKHNIDFDAIKNHRMQNAVESVSCKEIKEFKSGQGSLKAAVIDLGLDKSIKTKLLIEGCDVYVVPYNTMAAQLKNINPDGIFISSGPGDPAENPEVINNLKEIIKLNLPVFGIGLGHQLLALAHGFVTRKLKYGHRGANQPVKDLTNGRLYITSQNHGYTVEPDSINTDIARILFQNVNDKSCEGIEYKDKPVFSAEFIPECRNRSDKNTGFLFDRFINSMKNMKKNK